MSCLPAVLLLAAPAFAADDAAPPPRPNVLFIAVDDLNDWLGCYRKFNGGHPDTLTPNFDRLAARSLLFTNASCVHPVCNPSRTALLTGMRGTTTGVYSNETYFRVVPGFEDAVTLPQHFRRHGYRAVQGGKIFHSSLGVMSDPASWDEQYTGTSGGAGGPPEGERFTHGLREHLRKNSYAHKAFDWAPTDTPIEHTGDWRVANFFSERLAGPASGEERPFFYAVGIFRPHLPWYVPRRFFELHPPSATRLPPLLETDRDDLPPRGLRWADPQVHDALTAEGKRTAAVAAYLACVSYADACLGRLLDGLDASPHGASTVVVLWGDHGWHLDQKQAWQKVKPWERTARVPLMIRVPGVTTAGAACDAPVSLLDLYPTLAEVCGLPPHPACEGRSLAPLLKDPAADWPHAALTICGEDTYSIRGNDFRLIRYPDGTEEVYDHRVDPWEWENLAFDGELNEEQRSARDRLAEYIPQNPAPAVHIESRPAYLKGEKVGQAPA